METLFVDTNVFLRFLTRDDAKKAAAAKNLFAQALQGKLNLVTSELVIAEIVWTLESFYKISKEEIQEKVSVILQSEGLTIPNQDCLIQALSYYRELNVDFIDAYNAVWMQNRSLARIVTYDRKHMTRFDFLKVEEP